MPSADQRAIAPRLPAHLVAGPAPELSDDSHWDGLDVRGDYSGARADGSDISGCLLTGARFNGAGLLRWRVADTVFKQCDLSAAQLSEAALSRVRFEDCRLLSIDLSGANLRDVVFSECRLVDANLRMVSAVHTHFERCQLSRADLYGARLSGATIFDCDLEAALLSRANFERARLHGSNLRALKGADALKGAVIGPDQAVLLALQLLAHAGITVEDDRHSTA